MFGVIQWVVLMPYLRKAWLWVAVNGLSFIVGVESFNSWYFGYLLIWWCIFHAIVQATTLGWLFRRLEQETEINQKGCEKGSIVIKKGRINLPFLIIQRSD